MEILAGILAIFLLFTFMKVLSVPLRIIKWILVNGAGGLFLLLIFNLLGGLIGLSVKITLLNSVIAGALGIPGVIILLILG